MSITAIMPSRDGLVAEYNLNRNTTQPPASGGVPYRALDIVGGNHGTNAGATLVADHSGNLDGAYNFDGVNDYLELQSLAFNTFTIEFRIKANFSGNHYILSKGTSSTSQLVIQMSSTSLSFLLTIGSVNICVFAVTGLSLNNGQWYKVRFTSDRTTNRAYIDDVLQTLATGSKAATADTLTGLLWIGRLRNSTVYSAYDIEGLIITNAFDSITTGLVAHYPLNQANSTSTVIVDTSGNGNHATNSGATLTTDKYGRANEAYSLLAASSNYISRNALANITVAGDFTLPIAFKATATTGTQNLISHCLGTDDRINLAIISGNLVGSYYDGTSYTKSGSIDTSWHLAILRKAGTTLTLLLDNVALTGTEAGSSAANVGFSIGRRTDNTSFFGGSLSRFPLVSRAWTDSECTKLYNFWLSH